MTSVAQRKRARREAVRIRAVTPKPDQPIPKQTTSARKYENDTGLAWLEHKKQITRDQRLTGERYGRWYRFAAIESAAAVKSCLTNEGIGGSGNSGKLAELHEHTLIEAREKLTVARSILNNHAGMIYAMDYVCGLQRQVFDLKELDQRQQAQVVNSLRLALDMLRDVR